MTTPVVLLYFIGLHCFIYVHYLHLRSSQLDSKLHRWRLRLLGIVLCLPIAQSHLFVFNYDPSTVHYGFQAFKEHYQAGILILILQV
jgi:hypothetical protein